MTSESTLCGALPAAFILLAVQLCALINTISHHRSTQMADLGWNELLSQFSFNAPLRRMSSNLWLAFALSECPFSAIEKVDKYTIWMKDSELCGPLVKGKGLKIRSSFEYCTLFDL